jgi:hypothetical protein
MCKTETRDSSVTAFVRTDGGLELAASIMVCAKWGGWRRACASCARGVPFNDRLCIMETIAPHTAQAALSRYTVHPEHKNGNQCND